MGQELETKTIVKHVYKNPFIFVINIVSVMVSWYFNKSVLWAIFHYVFGLIYLMYSLLIGRFADGGFMEIMNSYF
jgi:hypothetical protein